MDITKSSKGHNVTLYITGTQSEVLGYCAGLYNWGATETKVEPSDCEEIGSDSQFYRAVLYLNKEKLLKAWVAQAQDDATYKGFASRADKGKKGGIKLVVDMILREKAEQKLAAIMDDSDEIPEAPEMEEREMAMV